jgi:hypothetical protein
MTTGRLANSIFQGRPSDKLLVKDTYEVTNTETRNSVFETTKGIYSDAIDGLKGNTSSPRELTELVLGAKNGNLTKMEMVEKALGTMGSSLPSLLGQVGGTLANVLGDTLGESGYGDIAQLGKLLYGAAPTFIKGADVDDADSLIRFVGELTGKGDLMEFVNLGAEAGILSGIAKQLVRYGVGDLVDDVAEMAHDESVKNAIFRAIIENAINTSDLKSVNKALDKLGADGLLAERPNAIAEILAGYKFPEDFDMRLAAAERVKLISTLARISIYWSTKLRNGVAIPDYKNWVALGTDAKVLMMMAEPERTMAISCGAIRPMNVAGVQAELYPAGYVVNKSNA